MADDDSERETGADPLADEEAAAAAAEAAAIGGSVRRDDDYDPALGPVVEAGGGEAEGFEQAEQELIDNAQHGNDRSPNPLNDRFSEEAESDRAGASYGEADHERSAERADDRVADADAENS